MKSNTMFMVALGALCLTACSSNTTSPSRQFVNAPVVNTNSIQANADVLGTLIVLNKYEIAAAKEAKHRATHPSVKNYASFMYKEHRNNLHATVGLAQQLKIKPNRNNKVASMLRQQGSRQLGELRRVKVSAFDRTYMAAMVKDHTAALNLVDGFYNASNNGLIRNQLKVTRAHIAEHLQMAKVIQAEIG